MLCRYRHNLHWTKHPERLGRDFGQRRRGDAGAALEELCAELGAALLCADLGLVPEIRDDHAPYIGHWLQVLEDDPKAIFTAAAQAERAVAWLQERQAGQASNGEAFSANI